MDVEIIDEGSVVLFVPLNDESRTWMDDNLDYEPYQKIGSGIAIDHRFAGIVIDALMDNNFKVG